MKARVSIRSACTLFLLMFGLPVSAEQVPRSEPSLSVILPPTECLIQESECVIGLDPDGNVIFPQGLPATMCGGGRRPVGIQNCSTTDPEGRSVNGVIVLCEICLTSIEPIVVVCGNRCPDSYQPIESRSDPSCGDNFEALICALEAGDR